MHHSLSLLYPLNPVPPRSLRTAPQVYGMSFQTHGLGGVLTCGVTGVGAGLSHSPMEGGKERYVFFSFPHIGIDSNVSQRGGREAERWGFILRQSCEFCKAGPLNQPLLYRYEGCEDAAQAA